MACFFDDQYSMVLGPMIRSQIHRFDDVVRQVIDTSVIPRGDTFTIGDYGCYNGFSSQEILEYIVGSLKQECGEEIPVHIIYEDQNSNDYNALIQTVCSNGKVSINHPKVYMSMCPTSFHEQCVPDNTFHLLLCFWSAHYLSNSVSYKDSLLTFPDGTRDEINAVVTQASDNWQQFLLNRANEIKHGGRMMLMVPAEDRERKYGQSRVHLQNMWVAMTSVWRLFRDTDLITECEYEAANYSGYYRSEEELRAPFCDEASPVVKAGLRIKSLEISHHEPYSMKPMENTKEENGWKEDIETSVARFVCTIRSWTEHIFLQALSSRSQVSRRDVVNTFYDRLLEHLKQQDISNCGWNNIIAYIVITKK
ncbi:uncharacterized protein [Haliotis cracherodii]|uniref:uncharacterized protein n=1 Tax=Haliotis cracherodii TaxID=6455 RepID=UPI0039E9DE6B